MKGIKEFYNKTAPEWTNKWYEDESLLPYLKEFINYLPENPRVLDLFVKELLLEKESPWKYYIFKKCIRTN